MKFKAIVTVKNIDGEIFDITPEPYQCETAQQAFDFFLRNNYGPNGEWMILNVEILEPEFGN